MITYITLPNPYPVPRKLHRFQFKPTQPWVRHLHPNNTHTYEPYLLNDTPNGITREYYPHVPEGHTIEINHPTSWATANRYKLTRRKGQLHRE